MLSQYLLAFISAYHSGFESNGQGQLPNNRLCLEDGFQSLQCCLLDNWKVVYDYDGSPVENETPKVQVGQGTLVTISSQDRNINS